MRYKIEAIITLLSIIVTLPSFSQVPFLPIKVNSDSVYIEKRDIVDSLISNYLVMDTYDCDADTSYLSSYKFELNNIEKLNDTLPLYFLDNKLVSKSISGKWLVFDKINHVNIITPTPAQKAFGEIGRNGVVLFYKKPPILEMQLKGFEKMLNDSSNMYVINGFVGESDTTIVEFNYIREFTHSRDTSGRFLFGNIYLINLE